VGMYFFDDALVKLHKSVGFSWDIVTITFFLCQRIKSFF